MHRSLDDVPGGADTAPRLVRIVVIVVLGVVSIQNFVINKMDACFGIAYLNE